jgi:HK97 gp10 family phage protein
MPIEIRGIDEIKAKLGRLGNAKTKLAIQRAGARKAAKVLLAQQQDSVPFDTGKLEDSLGIQVRRRGDNIFVMIGPDKRFNFIGRFHEFGTKFMAGTHWMQKAFDASAHEALDAYTAEALRLFDKHEYDDLLSALESSLSPQGDEE